MTQAGGGESLALQERIKRPSAMMAAVKTVDLLNMMILGSRS